MHTQTNMKTNSRKNLILKMAYVVAVLQPAVILPQIVQIYTNQSAADVSLTTWVCLLILNILNLLYGIEFKIKPLIVGNSLWIAADIAVVAGILIYS